MAARGSESFLPPQRRALSSVALVRYVRAPRPLSKRAFADAFADADFAALTPRGTPALSRALLERLPKLRGVSIPTSGHEWLDVALLGVPVCHVPDFSSASC